MRQSSTRQDASGGADRVDVERHARARAMRPISRTGWIVPISLFAAMTETSAVSSRIALATASGSMRPSASTPT